MKMKMKKLQGKAGQDTRARRRRRRVQERTLERTLTFSPFIRNSGLGFDVHIDKPKRTRGKARMEKIRQDAEPLLSSSGKMAKKFFFV